MGKRHPNLEAAQRPCAQAYEKLTASQQANEFDEGGHAAKAEQLLDAFVVLTLRGWLRGKQPVGRNGRSTRDVN